MEKDEKQNQTSAKQLSSPTQSITAQNLIDQRFDRIAAAVGFSVYEILDRPPIAMLKRELSGDTAPIETFLSIQINNLCDTVNVNENLTFSGYQVVSLAHTLVELFPVESLEDFVLCFKRGALGFYGTIFKLDASVLCEWMQKYLDEKYQLIESKAHEMKTQTDNSNAVNYEAYKARVAETLKPEKPKYKIEDERPRQVTSDYKYFTVENLQIYATSQQHAEKLVEAMITTGELVREVIDNKK